MDNESFRRLMQDLEAGSPEAAEKLVQQYGDVILRVIRSRLNRLLRRQLDSEDVRQVVWASFFAHRSLYARFNAPEQLIAFLKSVAANKVIDECRRRIATATPGCANADWTRRASSRSINSPGRQTPARHGRTGAIGSTKAARASDR